MFPSNGSATRHLLPSTGSPRDGFPDFSGTMRCSDSLRTFSPRFVGASLGDTIPCACVRVSVQVRRRPGAWGITVWQPLASMSRWSRRASQVPGEPCCAYAVFFDPGGTHVPGLLRYVDAAPGPTKPKARRG